MNLKEIGDLHTEISLKCSLKEPKEGLYVSIIIPHPAVYDSEAEGCKLSINASIVDEPALNCIKSIIQKHKLKLKKTSDSLVIYKPRKT